ncbi:MAG TPA: type II secretion system protein [Candidatus Paceibacterota bacterium]|nr:type II secretion system protein [Candidatus Paceibacterota bacterium]
MRKKQRPAFSFQLSDRGSGSRVRISPKAGSRTLKAGFTLIEMLVSLSIFAIVMVVCVGALLALVGADKKAQALESAMNSLNVAIDEMVRSAREGTSFDGNYSEPYGCSSNNDSDTNDCTGGTQTFSFEPFGGGQTYEYKYQPNGQGGCFAGTPGGGCLMLSKDGGNSFLPVTGSDISINSLEFYVLGTKPGCDTGSGSSCTPEQPRVIITVDGTVYGGMVKDSTSFHLQTTVEQRVLDL